MHSSPKGKRAPACEDVADRVDFLLGVEEIDFAGGLAHGNEQGFQRFRFRFKRGGVSVVLLHGLLGVQQSASRGDV